MSDRTRVTVRPACDIHRILKATTVPAAVDGRTKSGRWANMCPACFTEHGVGLGTGKGQLLVVEGQPEPKVTTAGPDEPVLIVLVVLGDDTPAFDPRDN